MLLPESGQTFGIFHWEFSSHSDLGISHSADRKHIAVCANTIVPVANGVTKLKYHNAAVAFDRRKVILPA